MKVKVTIEVDIDEKQYDDTYCDYYHRIDRDTMELIKTEKSTNEMLSDMKDETSKQYVALKVNKYGQAQPKINTVLDSNDHEVETVAYLTLKGAKQWVYNEVMGIGND